jgi:hypothetical protein
MASKKKASKGRKSSGKRRATTSAKKSTKKSAAARKPAAAAKSAASKKKSRALKAAAKPAPGKKPVAKAKPAAKAKPVAKAKPATKAKPAVQRRTGGHIEKTYGRELLARGGPREREDSAFIGGPRASDDLAEEMGEEFVETATSGEDEGEDVLNQEVPEERGGPFVVTTAGTEFADGIDESNPKGAKPEPFPRT